MNKITLDIKQTFELGDLLEHMYNTNHLYIYLGTTDMVKDMIMVVSLFNINDGTYVHYCHPGHYRKVFK